MVLKQQFVVFSIPVRVKVNVRLHTEFSFSRLTLIFIE